MLKVFIITVLVSMSFSCANGKGSDKKVVFTLSSDKEIYYTGEYATISFNTKSDYDSLFLYINNIKQIDTPTDNSWRVNLGDIDKYGTVNYKVAIYNGRQRSERSGKISYYPKNSSKFRQLSVTKTIKRAADAYTQGYEFYNGLLYESSGEYGKSYLQSLEFPSLKVVKRVDLDQKYFGEGITILNDKLYLLTWKEKTAMVFNPETLEQIALFKYDTEGWGLTNDGEWLYMSDGSQYIYKIDPETFKTVSKIEVTTSRGFIHDINELEWIDGKIWANVYGYNNILVIDPDSGEVLEILEAKNLLSKEDIKADTDVFNGIARNPIDGKIYVTGKYWSKIFEIE